MSAAAVVVAAGLLGLLGTVAASLLKRRSDSETLGLDTLRLALDNQGRQIERNELRMAALEEEVRVCHRERDEDRRRHDAEIASLRRQIRGDDD